MRSRFPIPAFLSLSLVGLVIHVEDPHPQERMEIDLKDLTQISIPTEQPESFVELLTELLK
jgi:hypothetical protein